MLRWRKRTLGLRHLPHTADEVKSARLVVLRFAQQIWYRKEIRLLSAGKSLPQNSSLISLAPFFDSESKLIRVGGRLLKATVSFQQRHPVLIKKGHLAELIIKQIHHEAGHAGSRTVSALVAENYWIMSGLQLVKKVSRSCVTCLRFKARVSQPIMGDLPESRVGGC
jgi:hypothetical protein